MSTEFDHIDFTCSMCKTRHPEEQLCPGMEDSTPEAKALDILLSRPLSHYTPHMICIPVDDWKEAMRILEEQTNER